VVQQSKPQVTSLLSNDVLGRLERLRINATRLFTSKSRGEHLAGRGGTSVEFSDYRDYTPGDDVRFVDWNIFARLHRPYLKLYEEEEEIHVAVIIDTSSSMMFENKFELARQLGAAFGVMGLLGGERVSVFAFGGRERGSMRLPPATGRASMLKLFAFIENLQGGGSVQIEEGLYDFLRRQSGRGVVAILSDFLTSADLRRPFNLLFSAGLEIFGVQILGPQEIDPQVTGDTRLVDSESRHTLDVSSGAYLTSLYQEYRAAYESYLKENCQKRCGHFLSVSPKDSLEYILFSLFRHRGWVK